MIRGATTIRIVIPDTGHSYTARVVGYDVSADVAVLQASGASGLKTIAVGDSSSLTVGGAVTPVGNAGGTGVLRSSTGGGGALIARSPFRMPGRKRRPHRVL
ncbi:MAG TPA: trypsin-like peptidase domain-containing protein [Solirubrobacteraceae bacterium]